MDQRPRGVKTGSGPDGAAPRLNLLLGNDSAAVDRGHNLVTEYRNKARITGTPFDQAHGKVSGEPDVKSLMNTQRTTTTGNVLYIVDSKRPSAGCIMSEMHAYWQSLRQNGSVPLRADVRPDAISKILDYSFLIERVAPGMARLRLAGQHMIDLMGMELRGMPLCTVINQGSRKQMCKITETVFKAPQIAEVKLFAQSAHGCPGATGSMLLLPLKSDLDDVTRALGCLVTDGTGAARPRRFDLTGAKFTPVIRGGKIMHP